ncbi:MAG: hydroxymethylbilane synthase, partial [Pirellulaceae bacterium]
MESDVTIRLGTRGSALAKWQADWVTDQLQRLGYTVEVILITTQGDAQQTGPIGAIGSQGVFTKEIQRALLNGEVDLAVHSLKDLPTEKIPGLILAAVPQRETTADALVSPGGVSLAELPSGAKIGTGSMRRRAQILYNRDDLEVLDIRGNVDTRLRKLDEGEFDAIVLAHAGLKRLGLADRPLNLFDPAIMLPAIGQGALGLETRSDDEKTISAVQKLKHPESYTAVIAERSLLAALRGGCLAPIAAWAKADGKDVAMEAVVLSPDGKQRLATAGTASMDEADALGKRLA